MNRSEERKNVLTKFAKFSLGIFLNFAAYLSFLNLQSSINIEDGVGEFSVCIMSFLRCVLKLIISR